MNFENNWLPWITLRHFLPASSIRLLCATMVHDMSGGRLSLEELVEERLGGGDPFMEMWLIRPRGCSTQLASHLQQYVQKIVWQNDEEVQIGNEALGSEAALPLATLQFAFNLGGCGLFNTIKSLPDNEYIHAELKKVYDAISACAAYLDSSGEQEIDHLIKNIDTILGDVSSYLRIATLKHVGDLFCDLDQWGAAKIFYEHAKGELENIAKQDKLCDFALAMKVSISQSLATSSTITDGYAVGQQMLADLLKDSSSGQTMALANAGVDEYIAKARSNERPYQGDTRSAILISSLLSDSLITERAFTAWRAKKFSQAEAWFWSTLRRQTALGLLAASKSTKGHFASCLIEDLASRNKYDAETFKLAIGLLIESESSDRAKAVQWSEDLLDTCVNESLCQFVIDHTEAHAGARKYRRTVAIEIFSEWARHIGAEHGSVATMILTYLIRTGSDLNANFEKDGADFTACFKAVLDICKSRPEFRSGICDELSSVLAQRIGNAGWWTGADIALQLAAECAPVFKDKDLKEVVNAAMSLLKKTHPSDGNWVIVKPVIRLLGEVSVGRLAEFDSKFGSEIVSEVLRFNDSDSNGAYAADIIFALNSYPSALLNDNRVANQYKPLITQALEKASSISASNAVNYMMALLVAPRAIGKEAVSQMLKILGNVLDSVLRGKAALSFGAAYAPVRYLVAFRTKICRESDLPIDEFDRSLIKLYEKTKIVWHTAIGNPSIFSPLSLLRQHSAERAIVHNWVIASLELAEAIGQPEAMVTTLKAAMSQEQLRDGISLGFATRYADGVVRDPCVDLMPTESRGAFYAAIGRRLSALQGNVDRGFTTELFKSTLRHGPRQVDAAVFASISTRDVENLANMRQALDEYKARIGENRELSLTLAPLLDRWNQAVSA